MNKLPLPLGLEILWISSDRDQNPKKSLGLPTKLPKKPLGQKLTPQNFLVEFLSPKNLQKALNDITRKIWTTETEYLCLFIRTIWTFRLFFYPKKSLLKSSHPRKNAHQLFLPKKIPDSKMSKPKKILWSSPSLEIWILPPWATPHPFTFLNS